MLTADQARALAMAQAVDGELEDFLRTVMREIEAHAAALQLTLVAPSYELALEAMYALERLGFEAARRHNPKTDNWELEIAWPYPEMKFDAYDDYGDDL